MEFSERIFVMLLFLSWAEAPSFLVSIVQNEEHCNLRTVFVVLLPLRAAAGAFVRTNIVQSCIDNLIRSMFDIVLSSLRLATCVVFQFNIVQKRNDTSTVGGNPWHLSNR